jgi:hypothetical protein
MNRDMKWWYSYLIASYNQDRCDWAMQFCHEVLSVLRTNLWYCRKKVGPLIHGGPGYIIPRGGALSTKQKNIVISNIEAGRSGMLAEEEDDN